jgi:hypothetical protein
MRRKPVLFLLGLLAAIAADFAVEQGLLALGMAPHTAWYAGAGAFALVWAASFWLVLHLPPWKKPGT